MKMFMGNRVPQQAGHLVMNAMRGWSRMAGSVQDPACVWSLKANEWVVVYGDSSSLGSLARHFAHWQAEERGDPIFRCLSNGAT